MSSKLYLEPKHNLTSTGAWIRETLSYMPYHVILKLGVDFKGPEDLDFSNGNGEKILRDWFEKSGHELRMYGSPEELFENVKNWMHSWSFPLLRMCEPYTTTPVIYQSLKNEPFILKHDLFVHLQNMISNVCIEMNNILVRMMVVMFLRDCNRKLVAELDYYKCSDSFFDDLESSFVLIVKNQSEKLKKLQKKGTFSLSVFDGQEVVEKFFKILPKFDNIEDYGMFSLHVKQVFDEFPPQKHQKMYEKIYFHSTLLIESLKEFFSIHKDVFPGFDDMKLPTTVRVFQDNRKQFLLIDELNWVMGKDIRTNGLNSFKTIGVKEALRMVKNERKEDKIKFIEVPIKRTKHRTIPIVSVITLQSIQAVDALFELLYDLSIGMQLFQKLKKQEDQLMNKFFKQYKDYFDHSQDCQIFLKTRVTEVMMLVAGETFQGVLKRPANHVRNAKADGFTVQNLKNELGHLKLTEFFPDIRAHADVVYAHVVKEKKQEVLRTCDLFDAIHHCVLISFFKKFPKLATFVHKQNGCHRLVVRDCGCNSEQLIDAKFKFKNTVFREIKYSDVKHRKPAECSEVNAHISSNEFAGMISEVLVCHDGTELYYNDTVHRITIQKYCMKEDRDADVMLQILGGVLFSSMYRMFIVDQDEVNDWLSGIQYGTAEEDLDKAQKAMVTCSSIDKWPAKLKKRIYLRVIPTDVIEQNDNTRLVFGEEVVEMLPVALKLQGDCGKFEDRIQELHDAWFSENGCKAMTLSQLNSILDEFDINKDNITLVPDYIYFDGVWRNMCLGGGASIFHTLSPSRQIVVHRTQAQLQMFLEIVCDIDWTASAKEHLERSRNEFREQITQAMSRLDTCFESPFLQYDVTLLIAQALREHSYYKMCRENNKLTPLIKLFDCDFGDTISMSFFISECQNYGLRFKFPAAMKTENLEKVYLPVWKARLLLYFEWLDMFFGEDHPELKESIRKGLLTRVPLVEWKSEDDFMDVILSKNESALERVKVHAMKNAFELRLSLQKPFFTVNLKLSGQYNSHEWLKGTSWKDRKYINRDPKWMARETRENECFLLQSLENAKHVLEAEREAVKILEEIVSYTNKCKKSQKSGEKVKKEEERPQHSNASELKSKKLLATKMVKEMTEDRKKAESEKVQTAQTKLQKQLKQMRIKVEKPRSEDKETILKLTTELEESEKRHKITIDEITRKFEEEKQELLERLKLAENQLAEKEQMNKNLHSAYSQLALTNAEKELTIMNLRQQIE